MTKFLQGVRTTMNLRGWSHGSPTTNPILEKCQ